MKKLVLVCMAGLGCWAPGVANAQDTSPPPPPPPPPPRWEGALGLIVNHEASFNGSGEMVNKAVPAFYLRYGRFTITNASIFVTRGRDDVLRGASADLLKSDTLRLNLALRLDNGRQESASGKLIGLGDVRRTVRGRLSATWAPRPEWRVSAGLSPDLFNRGGGTTLDLGASREFQLGPGSRLSLGVGGLWGDGTYMQVRYGVTPEQAPASGYPVTLLGAGRVSLGVQATWRREFGERWMGFVGVGASHLSGTILKSPLVGGDDGWNASAGLAWRF